MKSVITFLDLNANPGLRSAMNEASQRDGGHHAPLATHVFIRNYCEIIGAAGIAVPTHTFWAATTATPRESFEMLRLSHQRLAELHASFLCPCSADSPFFPLMGKLGYRRLGTAEFFAHET